MTPMDSGGNFLLDYFIARLIGIDNPDAAVDWYLNRLSRNASGGADALMRRMGFDWTDERPSVDNYVRSLKADRNAGLNWGVPRKVETRIVGNRVVRTRWDR